MTPTDAAPHGPFRVTFVPGVTPGKWLRTWEERMPRSALAATTAEEDPAVRALHDGAADMCFVRLPVERAGLHLITLYDEVPVVVLPKEHELTLQESVSSADLDLADDLVLAPSDDLTMKQVIETIAAGTGLIVVPKSVARLHDRKDVEARPVTGVPPTQVALAWRVGNEDPRIDTFIGIVRGRTAQSSRTEPTPPQPKKPAAKKPTAGRATAKPKVGTKKPNAKKAAGKSGHRSGGKRRGR